MSKILFAERWIEGANRRPKLCLIALAVLLAVQISPWLYPAVDGCLYLKTIRDFLSAESRLGFACYVPPGYLPLIAPAFLFGDRPFLAVSILQWVMAVALLGGLYVWARRQFPATAVLFTAAVMVNISVWTYYRRPLKEIASMAILMWTVNLMHALLEERRTRRAVGLTMAVALLTAYLTLIRYSAIIVTVGFTLAALLQARRRAFGWARAAAMSGAIGLTAAGALVGWLYYDSTHGGDSEYVRRIASIYQENGAVPSQTPAVDVAASHTASASSVAAARPTSRAVATATAVSANAPPDRLPSPAEDGPVPLQAPVASARWSAETVLLAARHFVLGVVYRINDVGCMMVPGLWKSAAPTTPTLSVPIAVFFILCLVIAFGWHKIVRRKLDVLALTLPAYALLYAHWVCDQPGGRFMLPMLPIITACAWYGLAALGRRRLLFFGLFIGLHLGQSTAYWLFIDAPRAYRVDQNWAVIDRFADEIRGEPGQVVVADEIQSDCQGLWFELGWGYRLRGLNAGIGPRVTWVVDEAGTRPIDGFSVDRVDGSLQLLHRSLPHRGDASIGAIDSSATRVVEIP